MYLPPLGPKDFVSSGNQPSDDESTVSSVQGVGTRASRRLHGMHSQSEQSTVNRWEVRGDPVDSTAVLTGATSRRNGTIAELGGNCDENFGVSDTTADQHTHSSFASNAAEIFAVQHATWEQTQTDRDDIMPTTTTTTTTTTAPTAAEDRVPVWKDLWTDSNHSALFTSSQ